MSSSSESATKPSSPLYDSNCLSTNLSTAASGDGASFHSSSVGEQDRRDIAARLSGFSKDSRKLKDLPQTAFRCLTPYVLDFSMNTTSTTNKDYAQAKENHLLDV